jgi:hypothetical protein
LPNFGKISKYQGFAKFGILIFYRDSFGIKRHPADQMIHFPESISMVYFMEEILTWQAVLLFRIACFFIHPSIYDTGTQQGYEVCS